MILYSFFGTDSLIFHQFEYFYHPKQVFITYKNLQAKYLSIIIFEWKMGPFKNYPKKGI